MAQISRENLLILASQAERGDANAQALINRALINGELASVPDPVAGSGWRLGANQITRSKVTRDGQIIKTEQMFNLLGLTCTTNDLAVIGISANTNPAYLMQWTGRRNGIIPFMGTLKCLEVPTVGVTDIDLYAATQATGKQGDLASGLTGQVALVTSGAVWTLDRELALVIPAGLNSKYLYLTCGAAGVPGAFGAGRFLLTLYGYDS